VYWEEGKACEGTANASKGKGEHPGTRGEGHKDGEIKDIERHDPCRGLLERASSPEEKRKKERSKGYQSSSKEKKWERKSPSVDKRKHMSDLQQKAQKGE